MTQDELNRQDELVDIRLPRSEVETLRTMIKERQTYNFLKLKLSNWWIFVIAGGFLTLFTLSEKIINLVRGI